MLLYELITTRYLTERATSVLYHYTTLENAASILSSKLFRLSSSIAMDDEHISGKESTKPYYMSTARSTQSAFIRTRKPSFFGVVFNLDGDWFNHHGYSVKPVDYFKGASPEKKEHEDRVLSKDPEIKFNGNALIRSVHIFMKQSDGEPEPNKLLRVMVEAKKLGIPVYVYDNFNSFILQSKPLNLSKVVSDLKKALHYSGYRNTNYAEKRAQRNKVTDSKNAKIDLKALYNLITAKGPEDLTPESIWIFDKNIRSPIGAGAEIKTIFRHIFNSPNTEYGKRLLQLVKATKIPPKDIFEKLAQKWIGLSYMINTRNAKNPYTKPISTPDEDSVF